MALTKKKGTKATPKLPDINALKQVNSNDAGAFYNSLFSAQHKVEYANKDIALSNIRTNPDNEIFRNLDEEDDIRILSEDIKRNGLMHNLVVFPTEEEGREVYVLLSGERRFRALKYLEEQGDSSWNVVRNCNVITTPLSANEKKVLLYSANLQVRGGFGDEAVRRQAIAEFINCLQQAPYNMSREEALGATKTVSSVNPRTIERDARIEDKLKGALKELLNAKILTRSECETYLRFEDDKQEEIAKRFVVLSNINCYGDDSEGAGKNHIEVMRDTLHDTFREYLFSALQQRTRAEHEETYKKSIEYFDSELQDYEAAFEKALQYFDENINDLKAKAEEYGKAKESSSAEEVAAIEHAGQREAARDLVKKERDVAENNTSIIQKATPRMVKKLQQAYTSRNFVKALRGVSKESREADIAALNEVIDIATKLKEKIESIE